MTNATKFLGKGLAVPLEVNTRGELKVATDVQKVQQSIRTILGTQYGDRLMRPTFGCNLRSLVFAPNNSATANLARYYVEEGLKTWEPRIQVEQVNVTNDLANGCLLINIHYTLKSTYEPYNLVYPFYLQTS